MNNNLSQLPNSRLTPSLAREFIMKKNAEIKKEYKKEYNKEHPQPYTVSHGGRRSRRIVRRVKGCKGRKTRSCKK